MNRQSKKFLIVIGVWMIVVVSLQSVEGQATREKTVVNAVARAADDGGVVVVLLHGSDWNQVGEKFKRDVFDSAELAAGLNGEVVLASVDCKEEPTTAESKLREGANKFPAVSIRTYPAIMVLDGVGRAVHVLQPVTQYDDPAALASVLGEWQKKLALRDEILVRARAASGVDQARLIGEALRELGVGLGPRDNESRKPSFHEALTAMKAADPGDESGWILATEFPYDQIVKSTDALREQSGLASAESELDKILGNPYLTAEQRQELQRQRFLLYKADSQPIEKQIEILQQVSSELPESIIGRGATKWAEYLQANPPGK